MNVVVDSHSASRHPRRCIVHVPPTLAACSVQSGEGQCRHREIHEVALETLIQDAGAGLMVLSGVISHNWCVRPDGIPVALH